MLANVSNAIKPSYSKLTYTFLSITHSEGKPGHLGVAYCHQCLCKTTY